jgi:signal transduction histidine kinase
MAGRGAPSRPADGLPGDPTEGDLDTMDRIQETLRRALDEDGFAPPDTLREDERVLAARVAELRRQARVHERRAQLAAEALKRIARIHQRTLRGLRAVQRVGGILSEASDANGICQAAVRILVEELGVENCSILLLDEDGRNLRLRAACGRRDSELSEAERGRFNRELVIPVGEGVAGTVVQTRRPMMIADVAKEGTFKRFDAEGVAVKSLLCFPLLSKSRVIGVINLSHPLIAQIGVELRRVLYLLSQMIGQVLTLSWMNRERLRAQFQRTEKLVAVGELSASVAHEINNPVTNILLRAQKLRRDAAAGEKVHTVAGEIERETVRIGRIVSRILEFAHRDEEEEPPERQNLNDLLEDTLILTEHHLTKKQRIRVRKALASELPDTLLRKGELEQVFTNLISNAAQAMPEGGDLTISTGVETDPQGATWIRVTLTDTGCGIPPENLERIFMPFFSTKKRGEGTGLGLPISRDLVQKNGGRIDVESVPGEGTSFHVVLPVR